MAINAASRHSHSLSYSRLTCALSPQLDKDWLAKNNGIPLLDIKLLLGQSKVADPGSPKTMITTLEARFSPPLDVGEATGFAAAAQPLEVQANGWITDYKNLACCIQRIDGHKDHYLIDVEASPVISEIVTGIHDLIAKNAEECRQFQLPFTNFDYLWTQNIQRSAAGHRLRVDPTQKCTFSHECACSCSRVLASRYSHVRIRMRVSAHA